MVDVGAAAKDLIPKVGISTSMIVYLIIAVVVLAIVFFVALLIIRFLKYNQKIIIFEKINGRFEPTRKDRAMEMKIGNAGDTVFLLKKHKKQIPTPTIQTGRKTYWFFVREDGEWINFSPGDYDADARKSGARFLDKEMRYARTQIQRGLKDRYDEPGFWKQYGLLVFSIGFIALIGILTFLLFDKWIDLARATNSGVETAGLVLEETRKIIGTLDNICSGGSGLVPV